MRILLGVMVLGGFLGCNGMGESPTIRSAEQAEASGHVDQAIERLEAARIHHPQSFDTRIELGQAYYHAARKALDAGRQEEYIRMLGHALDEFVEAARIDPSSPRTHTWMGIVAAYQDDLAGSLQDFRNSLKLDHRQPVAYTNIAQIFLYEGKISLARNWIRKAKKRGARGAYVQLLEALVAWRQGDLVEARDMFDLAYDLDPAQVNTWDEAPVDKPIENFNGFMAYCCSNHTCGPHMGNACKKMELAVKRRQIRDDTVRKELQLEMERRRKLREIYKGRKDLEIQVDPPAAPQSGPGR